MKPGAIGDVVHTTIITAAIKAKHPDWEVHYITRPYIAPLLINNSTVDKVYTYEKNGNQSFLELMSDLRKEHYDIIMPLSCTTRLILLAIGALPKKIGFRHAYKNKSWVEEYFYSAKRLMPDLELPDHLVLNNNKETETLIKKQLSEYPRPYIMFSPGKSEHQIREGRVWNIDKWKELAKELHATYGGTIFVLGSASEIKAHTQLEQDGVVILSGQYDLDGSCAVLSQADLVISGDSGPAHIATAYGVKTIAILGSTSPDKIKPYGKNGYVVEPKTECKYCWKKKCKYTKHGELYAPCIESITVEDVLNKVKEVM